MWKRNRLVIACSVAVFLVFAAILICLQSRGPQHQNLLKELNVSNVEYISIYASYGEQEARLSENDSTEIVRQLNMVNLTGSGTQDYAAQFSLRHPMFHIRLKAGAEFDFSAWKPYYIINTVNFGEKFGYSLESTAAVTGSGYRLLNGLHHYDYDVCRNLRVTYDALCREYFP